MRTARRELSNGGVVVSFDGEVALDAATNEALREELTQLGNGYERIVVDFTNVTFLDSSALGAFVGLLRRLNQKGGALRLAALRPGVRMVFEVTRLDRVFATAATVAEAEASLNEP